MKIYLKNSQRSKKLNLPRIKRDLSRALRLLGFEAAELSVVFVNSRRMRSLNALYRGIDRPTDVLSFPMAESGPPAEDGLLGDIVICVPKAETQASEYEVTFHDELQRLLVHGLLHLLGYDHECGSCRKRKMLTKEKELLHALQTMA